MPKKYSSTVGSDKKTPGEFYWNVSDMAGDVVVTRKGFKSKEDVTKDMQDFKKALDEPLFNLIIIVKD